MPLRQRRRFTSEFRARAACEALRETESVQATAACYELHANRLSRWKQHAEDVLAEVFSGNSGHMRAEERGCPGQDSQQACFQHTSRLTRIRTPARCAGSGSQAVAMRLDFPSGSVITLPGCETEEAHDRQSSIIVVPLRQFDADTRWGSVRYAMLSWSVSISR